MVGPGGSPEARKQNGLAKSGALSSPVWLADNPEHCPTADPNHVSLAAGSGATIPSRGGKGAELWRGRAHHLS
jgi:hypothetical protein